MGHNWIPDHHPSYLHQVYYVQYFQLGTWMMQRPTVTLYINAAMEILTAYINIIVLYCCYIFTTSWRGCTHNCSDINIHRYISAKQVKLYSDISSISCYITTVSNWRRMQIYIMYLYSSSTQVSTKELVIIRVLHLYSCVGSRTIVNSNSVWCYYVVTKNIYIYIYTW